MLVVAGHNNNKEKHSNYTGSGGEIQHFRTPDARTIPPCHVFGKIRREILQHEYIFFSEILLNGYRVNQRRVNTAVS